MRHSVAVRHAAWAVVLALCLLLAGCRASSPGRIRVLVDGEPWSGSQPADANGAMVYVTVDGETVAALPFGEAHAVTVRLPGGGENTVRLTGESVYMENADCENQDCVHMGEITLENIEMRVMGGFIICLPHKLSVEVRVP